LKTWHIVLKDLRRLRPWLALLVGAMLARYANFYAIDFDPFAPNSRFFDRIELIDGVMLGISLLVSALAAATLVHEDPVTGDRAFWLTRPIGGGRLLTAKILSWSLALLALPLAVQLGWWCYHGYTYTEIAAQLPVLAARQAGVAFPCFFCALLTRHLGSFLLTTIISALTVIVSHQLIEEFLKSKSRTNDINRLIVEISLAVFIASACIAYQYLTRRTARTIASAVSGLLVCLAINSAWRWPVYTKRPRIDQMPVLPPTPGLSATVGTPVPKLMRTGEISFSSPARSTIRNKRFLAAPLTIAPVPAGYLVELISRGKFPHDSLTLSHTEPFYRHPLSSTDYAYEAELILYPKNGVDVPTLLEPQTCDLTFALRRAVMATRLPLQEDAHGAFGPRSLRIARIWNWGGKTTRILKLPDGSTATATTTSIRNSQSLLLAIQEILPSHLPDIHNTYAEEDFLFGLASMLDYYGNPTNPRHHYFLIDTRNGQVIAPTNIRQRGSIITDGIQHRVIELTFPVLIREEDATHFELQKVLAPLVGTFKRQVIIPAATWIQPATEEKP